MTAPGVSCLTGSQHRWNHIFMCLRKLEDARTLAPKKSISGDRKKVFSRRVLRQAKTKVEKPVAPVAYQVILEPGIGQFRKFEPRRVHTCINSLGIFLVHTLTCGKCESVS